MPPRGGQKSKLKRRSNHQMNMLDRTKRVVCELPEGHRTGCRRNCECDADRAKSTNTVGGEPIGFPEWLEWLPNLVLKYTDEISLVETTVLACLWERFTNEDYDTKPLSPLAQGGSYKGCTLCAGSL